MLGFVNHFIAQSSHTYPIQLGLVLLDRVCQPWGSLRLIICLLHLWQLY